MAADWDKLVLSLAAPTFKHAMSLWMHGKEYGHWEDITTMICQYFVRLARSRHEDDLDVGGREPSVLANI
jgi:hypothetical protein